jgi:hypothetical protein
MRGAMGREGREEREGERGLTSSQSASFSKVPSLTSRR